MLRAASFAHAAAAGDRLGCAATAAHLSRSACARASFSRKLNGGPCGVDFGEGGREFMAGAFQTA
jgi:hypothetical protein